MSKAKGMFDGSIKDAEILLAHCQSLGHPLPESAEVFKRAGLVMALTAWETYVEERVGEAVRQRLPPNLSHAETSLCPETKATLLGRWRDSRSEGQRRGACRDVRRPFRRRERLQ